MDKVLIRIVGAVVLGGLAFSAMSLSDMPRVATSILIGLPSFVLMVISRRQLGKAFSVKPEAKALVTVGLYSRIQHPMYLFLDLFLIAAIVALQMPALLLIWGIIVGLQVLQGRREETVLSSAFGTAYDEYRSRAWF